MKICNIEFPNLVGYCGLSNFGPQFGYSSQVWNSIPKQKLREKKRKLNLALVA